MRFKRLLGKDVDEMSTLELKKEIRLLRYQSYIWVIAAVLIMVAVIYQRSEINRCWSGESVMILRNALDACTNNIDPAVGFNFTI